ncbi:MAG: hypothetical protein HY043_03820 [Verrucomicrobia bacterium]|nr:hypothetical protein [Verrucomicrobiota bacterium]
MKLQNYFLTLLLIFVVCPGDTTAQAQASVAVAAWGNNDSGQTTVPVAAQSGVMAIAAGARHTVALKSDGSVVAWGRNDSGQATVPVVAQSGVTAIAAGGNHTVALKNDGSVVAWGWNENGQTTVPVAAQSGVIAIAAGDAHSVALKSDGTVVAWGDNNSGQVTAAPTTNAPSATASPVTLNGQVLSGVKAIAAGGYHTVALKSDGSVVAWGQNDSGQVNGTTSRSFAIANPVRLRGQTLDTVLLSGVIAIAAGEWHTVALRNDGSVVAWGHNSYDETTVPVTAQSGVVAIAAGGSYTVVLKSDGTIVAWGYNENGQMMVPMAAQGRVTALAAGWSHVAALVIPTAPTINVSPVSLAVSAWQSPSFTVTATGFPLYYRWRKDGVNLVGAMNATYRLPFAQTNHAGEYTVVVSNPAGSVTSTPPAVLTVNASISPGTVVAWGENASGQLDVPVAAQSGVTAISAGGIHYYGDRSIGYSLALKNDGSVVAWGTTNNASTGPDFRQSQVPAAAQSGVTAISAADFHAAVLKNDGTVVAWGDNRAGQVTGIPTFDQAGEPYFPIASPVTLNGQVLRGVTAIAAAGLHTFGLGGWGHTVALKKDGTVVAWGHNGGGQVTGTPTTNDPPAAIASPVILDGQVLSNITAISARAIHTVALKNGGTVVAWGFNTHGQVTGTPSTNNGAEVAIANPVILDGQVLNGVKEISAGAYHTVALKYDGTVVAWGANFYGQVTGTPTTNEPYSAIASPVTLEGQVLTGVKTIAAGGYYTAALKNDGTVVAWGDNGVGEITGATTTNNFGGWGSAIANPVTLRGQVLSGVTAIAASYIHTVALLGNVPLLPSLNTMTSGNEIIISWPTNAVGFRLQATTSLVPLVNWIDYASPSAVHGGQFTVTNSLSGDARFFRLLKR